MTSTEKLLKKALQMAESNAAHLDLASRYLCAAIGSPGASKPADVKTVRGLEPNKELAVRALCDIAQAYSASADTLVAIVDKMLRVEKGV